MIEAFDRALDNAFARCPTVGLASFGPFTGELHFESDIACQEWMSALIAPRTGAAAEFTCAFVSDPTAFEDLLAGGRDKSRVLEDDGYVAYWQSAPISLLHLIDTKRRRSLTWMARGRAPERIYSRPLLPILHALTLDSPWLPVHSAAVGRRGQFLTLAGSAGAGKTTASVACAIDGWDYAGDDFVLIHSEEMTVEPLYATARTRTNAPPSLADLIAATHVAVSDTEGDFRHELRFAEHPIGSRVKGGTIAAWLLPNRRGADLPEFWRGDPRAAFGALMPVTALHFPFGRGPMSARMLKAIGKVPVYFADTGNDPTAIPAAFESLLLQLVQP